MSQRHRRKDRDTTPTIHGQGYQDELEDWRGPALLALRSEEPHAPRNPAKTSDFESQEAETQQKSGSDRSIQVAQHTSLLEDNATVHSPQIDSERAELQPGKQAYALASILPSLPTRGVAQRSLGCATGSSCGLIWHDS